MNMIVFLLTISSTVQRLFESKSAAFVVPVADCDDYVVLQHVDVFGDENTHVDVDVDACVGADVSGLAAWVAVHVCDGCACSCS